MEETETPETQETPAAQLWCPGCLRQVAADDPELRVSFSPQAWELTPDGRLDVGHLSDVFADYEHLLCGVRVRLVCNATWSEELHEYVNGANAWVEVDQAGGRSEGAKDGDGNPLEGVYPFSDSVENDPAKWGPTYAALLVIYFNARLKLGVQLEAGRF